MKLEKYYPITGSEPLSERLGVPVMPSEADYDVPVYGEPEYRIVINRRLYTALRAAPDIARKAFATLCLAGLLALPIASEHHYETVTKPNAERRVAHLRWLGKRLGGLDVDRFNAGGTMVTLYTKEGEPVAAVLSTKLNPAQRVTFDPARLEELIQDSPTSRKRGSTRR